jgi:hypothetical protein
MQPDRVVMSVCRGFIFACAAVVPLGAMAQTAQAQVSADLAAAAGRPNELPPAPPPFLGNQDLPGNSPTLPNSNLPGSVTTEHPVVLPNTDSWTPPEPLQAPVLQAIAQSQAEVGAARADAAQARDVAAQARQDVADARDETADARAEIAALREQLADQQQRLNDALNQAP